MPYKHNQSRRHKIEKAHYKVTNWPEYNQALRQRGDVTIWFTEEALAAWRPTKTGARGRPQEYSDLAIETALFLRQVFHLPLRQTEGFMNSLSRLMKSVISIPDYSSISKRSISLPRHVLSQAIEPGSLVIVDTTGLKVYGKDEWHQEKHDVPARRTWRKLHLAIDEHHQILACELTTPEVGDPSAVADLLTQIVTPFETFIGDGAYDGEPVSRAVLDHQPHAPEVIPDSGLFRGPNQNLREAANAIGGQVYDPARSRLCRVPCVAHSYQAPASNGGASFIQPISSARALN